MPARYVQCKNLWRNRKSNSRGSSTRSTAVKLLNEKSPPSLSNSATRPTGCFGPPPDFSRMMSPNRRRRFSSFLASTSRYAISESFSVPSLVKFVFLITPTFTKGGSSPFQSPLENLQTSSSVFVSHPFFIASLGWFSALLRSQHPARQSHP